jgi:hypothetical protein
MEIEANIETKYFLFFKAELYDLLCNVLDRLCRSGKLDLIIAYNALVHRIPECSAQDTKLASCEEFNHSKRESASFNKNKTLKITGCKESIRKFVKN